MRLHTLHRLGALLFLAPLSAWAQVPASAVDGEAPAVVAPAGAPAAEAPAATEPPPVQAMGTLVVEAPPGQVVKVDGQEIGTTPIPGPWTVKAGAHQIIVGEDAKGIEVAAGRRAEARFKTDAAVVQPNAPQVNVQVVQTGPGFSMATTGYVTAGVGLAIAGAGVYFGFAAQDKADEVAALDRRDARASRDRMQSAVDEADQLAFFANAAYGVGGVAILSGVAMILLSSDGPLGDGVTLLPTKSGAVLGGQF